MRWLAWPARKPALASYADKIIKNRFAAEQVHEFIRPMRTVGVLRRDETRKIIEIAEPFGVVAAIVPSTNPTSTAIYKILIALKARCAIVISPHPSAARCISRTAEIMAAAAARAGAPADVIGWMSIVTLEGTQELMRQREVAVILATGGLGLVRAAYSAGKPAYGVGPGNAPCYVHQSADVAKAAQDIILGKSFDNGLLCSSPNSIVADKAIDGALKAALDVERRPLPDGRRGPETRGRARHPAAAPQPGPGRQDRDPDRRNRRDRRPSGHAGPDRGARRRRPRPSALDREALPRPVLLRRRATGARDASAASRCCATAAWATPCRSTRQTTT